jgi:transposase
VEADRKLKEEGEAEFKRQCRGGKPEKKDEERISVTVTQKRMYALLNCLVQLRSK